MLLLRDHSGSCIAIACAPSVEDRLLQGTAHMLAVTLKMRSGEPKHDFEDAVSGSRVRTDTAALGSEYICQLKVAVSFHASPIW